MVSLHPGVTREQVQETCGWPVKFADTLDETPAPTATRADDAARPQGAHREGARADGGGGIDA